MNCLHYFPRSSALPLQGFKGHQTKLSSPPPFSVPVNMAMKNFNDLYRSLAVKAISGSSASADTSGADLKEDTEKSETYSHNMTEAMGAVLTYGHELGMNCNFISPDLIVGSCLQTPEDVDKLREVGVKTIYCLQQDPDLEYFGVDINAIREYAKKCSDIQHLRAEIRDFDAFDLRIRLPAVVSKLYKAINRNGGVTYIHCTAGLGRAPAVAVAYMFWVQGYKLGDAHDLLLNKRPCFPKIDAIKSATADILTGHRKKLVTLTWKDDNCSTVEVSGLDIGWGQKEIGRGTPLKLDEEHGLWNLKRELLAYVRFNSLQIRLFSTCSRRQRGWSRGGCIAKDRIHDLSHGDQSRKGSLPLNYPIQIGSNIHEHLMTEAKIEVREAYPCHTTFVLKHFHFQQSLLNYIPFSSTKRQKAKTKTKF